MPIAYLMITDSLTDKQMHKLMRFERHDSSNNIIDVNSVIIIIGSLA